MTVLVVGSGLGGLAAAITAHELGLHPVVLEKGERFGGASAASGGQVWVGANHVMEREGLADSVEDTLAYVRALAGDGDAVLDPAVARQWVEGGRAAAREFEDLGVIRWEVIPGYPDYYWPDVEGARSEGRYLTGAPFDGGRLGADRERLAPAPHFPIGLTYAELFAHGRTAPRPAGDVLTFGQGIAAAFAAAVLARGIEIRTGAEVTGLLTRDGKVIGVRCGADEVRGPVILATGAHDWAPDTGRWTGIPTEDAGSVAPRTLTGDGMALAAAAGADVASVPRWAAPVLPGYRLPQPQFPGDTGDRACWELSLPHTFLVNRTGRRFADDSFHPSIVRAALPNLPMFMVWDATHHRRYGLGPTPPGEPYHEGLVTTAATLPALGEALGIDPDGLTATAERFNRGAAAGEDPDFGRGTNLSTRMFRGDRGHRPNPNLGPVETPPFHGMRVRLVSTGITTAGIRTGRSGRALRTDGSPIAGLHAVGECTARTAGGSGYNSGYSLGRAMTFGWLAAHDLAGC